MASLVVNPSAPVGNPMPTTPATSTPGHRSVAFAKLFQPNANAATRSSSVAATTGVPLASPIQGIPTCDKLKQLGQQFVELARKVAPIGKPAAPVAPANRIGDADPFAELGELSGQVKTLLGKYDQMEAE